MSDVPDSPPPTPSRPRIPGWASLVLRLVATAALMAYALRGIEWGGFRRVLAQADWRWWIAGFATSLAVQVVAGARWAALARPIGFPFPRSFFVWRFFEGMFFSLCLPSSIGGDVVKAYRLGDTGPRRLLAGCTVLADRLTGLAALAALAGTAIIANEYELGMPATVAVAAGLVLAVLTAFRLGVGSLDRLLTVLPTPHPAREFIGRLLPYQRRPSLLTKAVAWSFVVQIGGAVAVALIARALAVEVPLTVWFSVVPLVALAMVLPISINGVGVREGGLKLLLAPHGVAAEQAVAIGLLWFLGTVLAGLIGGVLFLLDRTPTGVAATPPAVGTATVDAPRA